ncbi:MAG TPA: CBS domain-containing protein [Candidatus Saccharimonas sp.]|nr:CBS domain-containing protein [Candidatus Saccharimonas sp.]
MELVVELAAIALTLILAIVKSFNYAPRGGSDFEVSRHAHAGNAHAVAELERRKLLPAFVALQYIKEIIISVGIAALLLTTHSAAVGALLSAVYFFIAYLVAVRGWIAKPSQAVQRKFEPLFTKMVRVLAGPLRFMYDKRHSVNTAIASADELAHLIDTTHVLAPEQKTALLAGLHQHEKTIGEIMVPRDHIATVDVSETVGPLLLDKLHKQGHQTFVAIDGDLEHVKGLLHMRDATSGHPAIKVVADAMRPQVYYAAARNTVLSLLGASLQSGRQLFIVVDDNGNIQGLVTLQDALTAILGSPPPANFHIATDPNKV